MAAYARLGVRIAALALALVVAACVASPVHDEGPGNRATTFSTSAGMQAAVTGSIDGRWYAGDGGESAVLPDGREITVMGDTFSGVVNPDGSRGRWRWFMHNAAIIVGHGAKKAYPTFVPMGALHVAGRRDYYWPQQVFMDGADLRVFVAHVYSTKDGAFHVIGTDLATFAVPPEGDPRLLGVGITPSSRAGDLWPLWGAAVISRGRYTYVFGSLNRHERFVFGFDYYLARVPREDVADPSAWRYWTGSGWTASQIDAVAVIPGTAGIGSTATVTPTRTGGFALIGKKNDVFARPADAYLAAWTASSLTGPFVESPRKLLDLSDVPRSTQTYLGLGHPEVALPRGKLLVSWCVLTRPISLGGYTPSGRYGLRYAAVDWP